MTFKTYHPDPEINREVIEENIEAERIDLAAGFPPKWWVCPQCEHAHHRGHFMNIGNHRCLHCGYAGDEGTMHIDDPRPEIEAEKEAA